MCKWIIEVSAFSFIVFSALILSVSVSEARELQVGSWGGNVRSGPGTNYAKIGSLQNGDPVVITKKLSSAGAEYPWFKIQYGNGKVGYQWGGLLCGFRKKINGTFGLCKKDNRSNPRVYDCNSLSSLRSLGNNTGTQITFFIGQTKDKFKIYWLDYEGNKTLYQTMGSGMSWTINTFPSHPWLAVRISPSGKKTCHSLIRGNKNASQWLLR